MNKCESNTVFIDEWHSLQNVSSLRIFSMYSSLAENTFLGPFITKMDQLYLQVPPHPKWLTLPECLSWNSAAHMYDWLIVLDL